MNADTETLSVYDRKVRDYAAMSQGKGCPFLDAFIGAMPEGARVLDLGCGPGAEAARMQDAGLLVDAVDASAEMVRHAREENGVEARQATFDTLSGKGLYDGIWASFSLLHAPKSEFPRHLATLRRMLKPGGRLAIGMKLGRGERRDALGRFYAYYTETELAGLLAAAGFRVSERSRGRGLGLDGTVSDWVEITAHG